jgi:hypothetical protein
VTVRFDEDWDSEESLRRHVRSRSFTTLAGLLESALDPPRIAFVLPGGKRGLDYAEEVRRAGEERAAKELLATPRSEQRWAERKRSRPLKPVEGHTWNQ